MAFKEPVLFLLLQTAPSCGFPLPRPGRGGLTLQSLIVLFSHFSPSKKE